MTLTALASASLPVLSCRRASASNTSCFADICVSSLRRTAVGNFLQSVDAENTCQSDASNTRGTQDGAGALCSCGQEDSWIRDQDITGFTERASRHRSAATIVT